MKIELLPGRELTTEHCARWREILQDTPELAGPYFRPEFVLAVAEVRPDVEVAILREGNDIVGFWPFERSGDIARPVGDLLSDYQGVVARANVPWNARELMQACRMSAWEFDHQLASQAQLRPFFARASLSWRLDLSAGFDAYVAERRANVAQLSGFLRKLRKLEAQHDVRVEWHLADEAAFDRLLAWKSQQYRHCGLRDLFAIEWIVALLRRIWQTQSPHFSGVLSGLYVDGELAAVDFGMRSGPVLHSWFPAYDVERAKLSPGSCLLLCVAREAASRGVQYIDLGKGDETHKRIFAGDTVAIAEGAIDTRPIQAALRQSWRATRDWVKQSPLREPARASLRWLRRAQNWWKVANLYLVHFITSDLFLTEGSCL